MSTPEDRILQLAETIRRFRAQGVDKTLSEQDTKALLVEPVLEIIGWDVHDPARVTREDRPTERPVDYSLKLAGKAVLMVECKRLANRLESRRDLEQALSYASSAGVRWCVLTNGCLLRIYNSLAPEVAEKKLLAEVDLAMVAETSRWSAASTVQTLQQISPQGIETGQIDQAWEERDTGTKIREVVKELWAKPDPGLVSLVRQRMRERGRTLSRKDTSRWLRSLDVKVMAGLAAADEEEEEAEPGGTVARPTRITIGADRGEIKYSYEILTKTAEWLIRQGKLKASDCPISSGRKRNIVNTKPSHRDGGDFRAPRQLSNGLWIETHHSMAGSTGCARRLLKTFGYSEDMLETE